MKTGNKIAFIIARGLSRCVVKMSFHPALYFTMLFLCLVQTVLTFISAQGTLFNVLKWFDISLYIDHKIVFYLLAGPCTLCAILIVIQNYWAAKESRVQTGIFQHYTIKITTTLSYFLAYALQLSVIRCGVGMAMSGMVVEKVLGLICLLLYLVLVYPYTVFMIADLSPQNGNITAVVSLPNCFTILNIFRPLAALIVCTGNSSQVIIPTSFLFVLLIVFLIKFPLLTWRYNAVSQGFISCIVWFAFLRILQLISGQLIPVILSLLGVPIFVFFCQWLLQKRLVSIINKEQNSVLKLKTLYFILINRDNHESELSIFLLSHYRVCPSPACSCHRIMQTLQRQKANNESIQGANEQCTLNKSLQKSTFSFMVKLKESKTKSKSLTKQKIDLSEQKLYEFQKQKEIWYDLLNQMLSEQFDIKGLRNLPLTEKDAKVKKAKQLILDQVEILHYRLNKQYQSLRCMWFNEEVNIDSLTSLYSVVRYLIEQWKQEETIQKKSKEDGSNQYALNYYELQTKMLSFKQLLLKTTLKVEGFWIELASKKPDQKKLAKSLEEILKNQMEIEQERKRALDQCQGGTSSGKNDYQVQWNAKIKQILENQYSYFCMAMKIGSSTAPTLNQNDNILDKKQKIIEKNIQFYDYESKTGMGIVNIQDGEQFGSISVTNSQFWQLLNCQKYPKACINHFLIKQMHEYHNRAIVNFLQQNKHFLSFHRGFVIDGSKLIVEIEFSVQLLPHLYEGLYAAVFLQEIKSQNAIFLIDQTSNMLAYNERFKNKFLQNRKIEEYDEIVTKEIITQLKQYHQANVAFEDEYFNLKLCHSIHGQNDSESLYYCEILREWDGVPMKTLAVEYDVKDSFYMMKNHELNEGRQMRDSMMSKAEPERQKQKKQKDKELQEEEELQNLVYGITNGKKSLKLKKWRIFSLSFLGMIAVFAVVICIMSQGRIGIFSSAHNFFNNLAQMTQHTAQSLFLARKVNILSYENQTQSLPSLKERLKELKELAKSDRLSINVGEWDVILPSYETVQNGQIIESSTTFEMVLQKYLLASLTTYIEQADHWNFDYLDDNKTGIFSVSYLSLINMIYNSYYTVLPKLTSQFEQFMTDKWQKKVTVPVPIMPLGLSVVTLALVIKAITILMKSKLLNATNESIFLLQKLKLDFLNQRMEILRKYIQFRHQDSKDKLNQKIRVNLRAQQAKTLIQKSFEIYLDKGQSNDQSEVTTRNFQLDTNRENEPTKLKAKRQKVELKFHPSGKIGIAVKVILSLLIISSFGMAAMVFQVYNNIQIWKLLQLRQFYNARIEKILQINCYTFEFGYETEIYKDRPFSITNQLPILLQEIYETLRQIKEAQNTHKNEFISKQNQLNQISFCQILQRICSDKPCAKCTPAQSLSYTKKSRDEILVQYIESARTLFNTYKAKHLSPSEQRVFRSNTLHLKLEQLSQHIIDIELYLLSFFQEKFLEKLKFYQTGIILINAWLVPVVFGLGYFWVKRQMKGMQMKIDKVRTIVEMISIVEIKRNQEIKRYMMDKADVFRFVT